jgi:electron transport complex protein RnfE
MKKNTPAERLYNGLVRENPTFVMMIGMCPTLAVTTSVINGIGMGLTTTVILTVSNLMISALRKFIPDGVRMPAYIGIVASFVTIVEFLLKAYIPSLNDALGLYIPLIVVNCIILGRAEAYAGKNKVLPSIFDGIGMGLGFTAGLIAISAVRELLGAGTLLGMQVLPDSYEPVGILIQAPGAFLVLALLTALLQRLQSRKRKGVPAPSGGCGSGCAGCGNSSCAGKQR